MYNTLKRMYLTGKLTKEGLDKAVLKGWITLEQENEILSLKQKGGDPFLRVRRQPGGLKPSNEERGRTSIEMLPLFFYFLIEISVYPFSPAYAADRPFVSAFFNVSTSGMI